MVTPLKMKLTTSKYFSKESVFFSLVVPRRSLPAYRFGAKFRDLGTFLSENYIIFTHIDEAR